MSGVRCVCLYGVIPLCVCGGVLGVGKLVLCLNEVIHARSGHCWLFTDGAFMILVH